MVENAADVEALRADVDALRNRFPKTADLYRETCALMFFRYGMTPTTNALYQLVRKGSMTVPSEALRQFWNDLRRQSRVAVENAGLPEELRELAGKLLGQMWSSARQAAEESVAHLRDDFAAERDALLAAKARADEQTSVITTKLEDANRAVAARDEALVALREQLSAERAKGQNVESQLAEARFQVDRLQLEALATSRDHAADIDKVTGGASHGGWVRTRGCWRPGRPVECRRTPTLCLIEALEPHFSSAPPPSTVSWIYPIYSSDVASQARATERCRSESPSHKGSQYARCILAREVVERLILRIRLSEMTNPDQCCQDA